MKTSPLSLLALALLAACESTGDPAAGGLFGWSETKAQQRIADRESALAFQESELQRERRTSGALQHAQARHRQEAAAASRGPSEEELILQSQLAELGRLAEEASVLEMNSVTPAAASRARRLRARIEQLRTDRSLALAERAATISEIRGELRGSRGQP